MLLSLISFKASLDLSYYFVISKLFRYAKFELRTNNMKLFESYCLFLIIFILMPKPSKRKISTIIIWLLILLSYIPMLTIFGLKDESRAFMYAATAFWIVVSFLLVYTAGISLRPLRLSKLISYSISIGLSVIVLYISYRYFGISFNFDWSKIYDIRAEYVAVNVPLSGYFFDWQGHIVNPMLFAIFAIKKRWFYAALIILFQFLLFSTIGIRNMLFSVPFVLILMWIVNRKNPVTYMAIGLAGIVSLGILSYSLVTDVWLSSLFTRRTLLVPAQLYFFYYDFFSEHGPIFLSTTRIFRTFIKYPYDVYPPHLIAETYFNLPDMGANTGIVGDAYMNFGFLGMFIWAFLLAMILKLLDACSRGKDMRIVIATVALPIITITNSALLTNILTHGLLLAIILAYLLPRRFFGWLRIVAVEDKGNSLPELS